MPKNRSVWEGLLNSGSARVLFYLFLNVFEILKLLGILSDILVLLRKVTSFYRYRNIPLHLDKLTVMK